MLKRNFVFAIRRLLKNKWYSAINIFGLAIGLSSVILMLFYINYEKSYDAFNTNYDRLFRVERTSISKIQKETWDSAPYSLSKELISNIPEITDAVNITPTSNYITFNDEMYHEKKGLYADDTFLKLFTVNLIQGDKYKSLESPMSILLSQSLVNKISSNGNIIGKTVRIDKKYDCIVTGVFEDHPVNSHLEMDYIISYNSHKAITGYKPDAGLNIFNSTIYVLLDNQANTDAVSKKVKNFLTSRITLNDGVQQLLSLRPLKDIYIKTSKVRGGGGKRSDVTILYLFLAVVIFTALITALNYINSTTAQVMDRELEIGIKKVLGIPQDHLRYQFIIESLVTVFIAFIISILLVLVILPFFNLVVDKDLSIVLSRDWLFFVNTAFAVLLLGALAGLYPVFFLSSLKISSFLQGNASIKRRAVLRKFLVAFQLAVVMPLIFISILIIEQISYIEKKDIGFVKEDLLVSRIETSDNQEMEYLKVLKDRLLQDPNVLDCTISDSAPFNGSTGQKNVNWEGGDTNDKVLLRAHAIDYDFLNTYKMSLIEGRNFSKEYATDIQNSCIINETTLRLFGWKSAVGKTIDDGKLKVIGVVKDFNDYTLFKKIPPMILVMDKGEHRSAYVTVKVASNNREETKVMVNNLFNTNFPETPLEFRFLESEFDRSFLNALRGVTKIFIFFSILAILLAILGLYNLVSFSLKTQKKMIAIRKVLGANIKSLFLLLLKEYLVLFAISVIIGLLTVYLVAGKAMNVFAYHQDVKFIYLIIAALMALFVVLISVSGKILSASKENPIDSIASE
ncbi:ABC transporter permease [Aquimarina sediminis]|uniref:ABC transporter permease n=1 Tax=Aquimarina sediminis TaxID=2070536 RepID=UPI000CA04611|nr:ABC transporter permease [Aquimarina sediminis]